MSSGPGRAMRQAIVAFMGGSSYRPATARDLMRLLKSDGTRRHEFKRTLRAPLNDEEIVKVGRDRYAVPGRAGRDGGGRDTRPAEAGVRSVTASPAPAAGRRSSRGSCAATREGSAS